MNINSQEFLKYFIETCPSNVRFIKSLRFNKRSITVKIDDEDKPFVFNSFFTEKRLYNLIISYLRTYLEEKGIRYPTSPDYLKFTFKKLNIR